MDVERLCVEGMGLFKIILVIMFESYFDLILYFCFFEYVLC